MAEAKDIDNSLDFLRYFEKYTESEDLLSVVQHKMEQNSDALDLIRHDLSEDDCKLLADLAPLARLKVLNLRETSLTTGDIDRVGKDHPTLGGIKHGRWNHIPGIRCGEHHFLSLYPQFLDLSGQPPDQNKTDNQSYC